MELRSTSGGSPNIDLLAVTYFVTVGLLRDRRLTESLLRSYAYLRPPLLEKLWPQFSKHSVVDQFRAASILSYLERAVSKDGDIAECGVFSGGTSLFMAAVLRELGVRKKLHMFDSFSGLPEPDRNYDRHYSGGTMRGNPEALRALLQEYDLADYCIIHEGWFSETLFQLPSSQEFCFVHIDCDLHNSAMECIHALYPRLQLGCPMVFDDYSDGSGGIQSAVENLVANTGELIFIGPPPQVTLVKGEIPLDKNDMYFTAEGTQFPVFSKEHLLEQRLFKSFLAEVCPFLTSICHDLQRFADLVNGANQDTYDFASLAFPTLVQALVQR